MKTDRTIRTIVRGDSCLDGIDSGLRSALQYSIEEAIRRAVETETQITEHRELGAAILARLGIPPRSPPG